MICRSVLLQLLLFISVEISTVVRALSLIRWWIAAGNVAKADIWIAHQMCIRSGKYDKMHYCRHKHPQFRTVAIGAKVRYWGSLYFYKWWCSVQRCCEIYDKMHFCKRYLAQFRRIEAGVESMKAPLLKRDTEAFRALRRYITFPPSYVAELEYSKKHL